jgi:hypothetical protein
MRVYQRGRSSTECEPAGNHQLIVNMTGDTDDEIRAQRRGQAMSCQCRPLAQSGQDHRQPCSFGAKSQNLDKIIMILNRR